MEPSTHRLPIPGEGELLSLGYEDSVIIRRPGEKTGAIGEFGQQADGTPTKLYDDGADIQDNPHSITVELSGDETLRDIARIFLEEGTDVTAFRAEEDTVHATYGRTGTTRNGTIIKTEPFNDAVIVKWSS